jgi:hypothetical protein
VFGLPGITVSALLLGLEIDQTHKMLTVSASPNTRTDTNGNGKNGWASGHGHGGLVVTVRNKLYRKRTVQRKQPPRAGSRGFDCDFERAAALEPSSGEWHARPFDDSDDVIRILTSHPALSLAVIVIEATTMAETNDPYC